MFEIKDFRPEGQLSIYDYEPRNPGEVVTLDTRADSNESVNRDLRYQQIIAILKTGDMTAKEIAVRMYELGEIPTSERNFSAPRLTELSKKGIVEPVGKKLCQYTNKKVAVYHLREEG